MVDQLPLPAHSSLGASSAERWMKCPGSPTLIALISKGRTAIDEDEPEWRWFGTYGHDVAAICLNKGWDAWEVLDQRPDAPAEMLDAVQFYIDYVRSRPGWKLPELKMHRPEFHELMFGTTDAACLDPGHLEVIDLKLGVGIVVEVEENEQIMYYAFMIIDELGEAWGDDEPITLTIVQPRVPYREPVRSWTTTVGHIRHWAKTELRAGMLRTTSAAHLQPGEHCRFCPAKLVCPAWLADALRVGKVTEDELKALTEPMLAELLGILPQASMAPKLIRTEARHRTIDNGKPIPGWKLVKSSGDRVFKDGAPIVEKFGDDAYQPRNLRSPAQLEKLDGGKAFVSQWAYSPDRGYDIVPSTDRRVEVVVDGTQKWKKLLDNLKPID